MGICKHCGDYYRKYACPVCQEKPKQECKVCHGEVAHGLLSGSDTTSSGLPRPQGLSFGQRRGQAKTDSGDNWNGSSDNIQRAHEDGND